MLARVVLPNPDGEWRPGLFVTGEILLEEVEVPVAVKASAVQTFRDWTVLFVNEGNFYEPLVIEPGRSDGEWVEIDGDSGTVKRENEHTSTEVRA